MKLYVQETREVVHGGTSEFPLTHDVEVYREATQPEVLRALAFFESERINRELENEETLRELALEAADAAHEDCRDGGAHWTNQALREAGYWAYALRMRDAIRARLYPKD